MHRYNAQGIRTQKVNASGETKRYSLDGSRVTYYYRKNI